MLLDPCLQNHKPNKFLFWINYPSPVFLLWPQEIDKDRWAHWEVKKFLISVLNRWAVGLVIDNRFLAAEPVLSISGAGCLTDNPSSEWDSSWDPRKKWKRKILQYNKHLRNTEDCLLTGSPRQEDILAPFWVSIPPRPCLRQKPKAESSIILGPATADRKWCLWVCTGALCYGHSDGFAAAVPLLRASRANSLQALGGLSATWAEGRLPRPQPSLIPFTTPIYSPNETVALNSKQRDIFWDPYNLKDINFGPLQKAITSPEPKLARFLLSEEQILKYWEEPCSPQLPTADSKSPVMANPRLLALNSHVLVPFPKQARTTLVSISFCQLFLGNY